MRRIAMLLFTLLLPTASLAQEGNDDLLAALAAAKTPAEAGALVPRIWEHWLTAPDAAAQEVLDAALRRRQAQDFLGALQQLDLLVAAYPDYAEGWNQRATVHFLIGDFDKSLADVEEVLRREPRHFGARAGRAMIYYQQGRLSLAQIAVRDALKYHPFLAERAILDIPAGDEL